MTKWKTEFATISNLWQDADSTPERGPIVVTEIEETDFCDVQFGFARVGKDWYKVVCVGEGDWQAAWSDRQGRFVTVGDESMIYRLNATAGLTA